MQQSPSQQPPLEASARNGVVAQRRRLLDYFMAAGYQRAEPEILQPAQVFLELSGEDIRSRIFLTSDPAGAEFCVRPEFTIPVCRDYLASSGAGSPAGFSYLGPVFRYQRGAAAETNQVGIESFGRGDCEAADAEILTLSLEACGDDAAKLETRFGDAGLFNAVMDALALPPGWLRRIRRGHMRGQKLDEILASVASAAGEDHSGVLRALEGADRDGARALVENLLSIAGISSVGGRSIGEITDRFLEQASMKAETGVPEAKRKVLERFLAISGDPDASSARLRALAREAGLNLGAALDAFDARLGFIAARGLKVSQLHFSASFARNLDYYTGFVFEAREKGRPDAQPIIGGGRYDRLMRSLGAPDDISAVGAAIFCDRLYGLGSAA